MLDPEVRETLSRHGLSDSDIEAMAAFESAAKSRRRKPRVKPEPLDFGDWA